MEAKQHISEQQTNRGKNQKGNKNLHGTNANENMTTQNLWDSLKSNAKRKVYSITSLPQEIREKSNK